MSDTEKTALAVFKDLLAQGRTKEADESVHELLRREPGSGTAFFELGNLQQHRSNHIGAIEFYQRALDAEPQHVEARCHLSGSLEALGQFDDAVRELQRAVELSSDNPLIYHTLGVNLQQTGRLVEAKEAYTRALSLKADLADSHNNLGVVLVALGCPDEAIRHFNSALRLNPRLHDAVYHRAFAKKHRRVDSELKRIESRFNSRSVDDAERASLGFALGKAYDDIGNYTKAARFFVVANQLQRSIQPYHVEDEIESFRKTRRAFENDPLRNIQVSSRASFRPLFIVGMPRSGSSLLERILASHSKIAGAGELEALDQAIRSVMPYYQADVPTVTSSQLEEIANSYIDRVSTLVSGEPTIVVDKMPRNFEYLGVIRAAFPGSRVITTIRDPLDICLSCFQQRFASQRQAFSNDLGDLGRYFLAHEELMNIWDGLFPGWIESVVYEDLVSDPEAIIRRVLSVLDLDFESSCLEHHSNADHSTNTASAVQVTEPIHRRAVGKSKNYKKLLEPLREHLESP